VPHYAFFALNSLSPIQWPPKAGTLSRKKHTQIPPVLPALSSIFFRNYGLKNVMRRAVKNTGLLKMIVGLLTICHTQYT
jgi:hypothetical protein